MSQLSNVQEPFRRPVPALPGFAERQNPHSPLRRLVDAMARGRALLVLTTALGATLATGFAILKPNEFVSTATFRVREGSEDVSVQPVLEHALPVTRIGISQNAPHILAHQDLASRTVERVGLAKIFAPYIPTLDGETAWPRSTILDLQRQLHDVDLAQFTAADGIKALLGRLRVTDYGAGMLTVQYTANSAGLAQEVLEAFVDEAQKFHMEIYRDEQAIQLVEEQHAATAEKHAQVRARFDAFLAKAGVFDFIKELEAARLSDTTLRREKDQLEDSIPGLEFAAKDLEEEFESAPIMVENPVPLTGSDQTLITKYAETRANLVQQKQTFVEGSKERLSVERAIAELDADIARERERPRKVEVLKYNVPNPALPVLREKLRDARLKLTDARTKVAKMVERSREAEQKWQALARLEPEHARLAKELVEVEKDLQRTQSALDQARNKQQLDESRLSSLKLVTAPTFNPLKDGPNRGRLVLAGLFGGFGLGVVLLAFRALTDTTVRTPEELEQLVGLRVLATVPELSGKNLRRHEQRCLSGC